MEIEINRGAGSDRSTDGQLWIDHKFICYTLEDCDREIDGVDVSEWKIKHETAIPCGRYRVVKDYSNRFKKEMLHIINVPGFTGIRIHAGNTNKDTSGCILVGLRRGQDVVYDSRKALKKVEDIVFKALDSGEQVFIEIF